VTTLPEGRSHYLHITSRPGQAVQHTLELEPGLNVDLDDDGRVLGVEAIGRRVTIGDLTRLLATCIVVADVAR
jgi:uncharacterized protein YuzE